MNERETLLSELFDTTVQALRDRIAGGEASPQDIKNAIQLLKDNGITCETTNGEPLAELLEELPFPLKRIK